MMQPEDVGWLVLFCWIIIIGALCFGEAISLDSLIISITMAQVGMFLVSNK